MRYRLKGWLLGCAAFLPLTACAQLPQACPYSAAPDSAVSAGCFHVQDDRLLVVEHWTGKLGLPGGLSRRGESAQCTAYRETWEETGLLLQPLERIEGFKNSYFLYRCQRSGQSGSIDPGSGLEIRRVLFISPDEFGDFQWRFPGDTQLIQHLLIEALRNQ